MVGNFIADLIRPTDVAGLDASLQLGVTLHRYIDSYTDSSSIVRKCLPLLYPRHHKYAGVLLDIYFDHFLYIDWAQYDERPMDDVLATFYEKLALYQTQLPSYLHEYVSRLLERKWLAHAYDSYDSLETTFGYLTRRTSLPEYIEGAVATFHSNYNTLHQSFHQFYPTLMHAASGWRTHHITPLY